MILRSMCAGFFLVFFIILCTGEQSNTANVSVTSNATRGSISPIMEKHEVALLQLLGFGGFSIILAIIYNTTRKYVFNDVDKLDTSFDAGGNVSTSLTAVTWASQQLWPGSFLQGPSITAKNGIGGTIWFCVGSCINVILFPIFSLQLKIRAPGAKTFLQLIHARFGEKAHILFIIFGLLTNLLVLTVLLVASIATFQSMTKDASPEFSILLIATLFGSYSFVGGLGSTFYVSYFNAVLIFVILVILVINIFYLDQEGQMGFFGSFETIYKQLSSLEAPEGNEERSYLTFSSEGALIWTLHGLFAVTAILFCDQATWQSRIAAKPVQGVVGFFLGTLMLFVALSVCSSTGLAYLALSSVDSSFTLSEGNIDAGLVLPFLVEKTLGYGGGVMMLTLLTMAMMSTGSGEVMAVSSIIVYDIYQIHINPFRRQHTPLHCLICGEKTGSCRDSNDTTGQQNGYCACPPVGACDECDNDHMKSVEQKNKNLFSCKHHGQFRRYQDSLIRFKSWCILWVTIALVPWGLAVNVSGINLNWIFMAGFTLTTPGFTGVLLSIMWVKTSRQGIIAGAIAGLVAGFTGLLSVASAYDGGLSNFLVNTSQNYSAIASTGCGFLVSLLVTVVVSFFTHTIIDETAELAEWQKLRDIDNPLNPWADMFREDFPLLNGARPTAEQLNTNFKKAKWVAYIGGGVILLLIIVVMPSILMSFHVLTSSQFSIFLFTFQIIFLVLVGIGIVMTPLEEGLIIIKQMRKRKRTETTQFRLMEQENELKRNLCGNASNWHSTHTRL